MPSLHQLLLAQSPRIQTRPFKLLAWIGLLIKNIPISIFNQNQNKAINGKNPLRDVNNWSGFKLWRSSTEVLTESSTMTSALFPALALDPEASGRLNRGQWVTWSGTTSEQGGARREKGVMRSVTVCPSEPTRQISLLPDNKLRVLPRLCSAAVRVRIKQAKMFRKCTERCVWGNFFKQGADYRPHGD